MPLHPRRGFSLVSFRVTEMSPAAEFRRWAGGAEEESMRCATRHGHQSWLSSTAINLGYQSRLSSTAIVVTTINRGCHTRPSSSLPLQLATRCNSTKTTDILIANALHVGHIFVMVLSSHTCRFLSSSCEILRTHANAAMGFFQILRGRAVVAAFFGDLVWLPGLRQEV